MPEEPPRLCWGDQIHEGIVERTSRCDVDGNVHEVVASREALAIKEAFQYLSHEAHWQPSDHHRGPMFHTSGIRIVHQTLAGRHLLGARRQTRLAGLPRKSGGQAAIGRNHRRRRRTLPLRTSSGLAPLVMRSERNRLPDVDECVLHIERPAIVCANAQIRRTRRCRRRRGRRGFVQGDRRGRLNNGPPMLILTSRFLLLRMLCVVRIFSRHRPAPVVPRLERGNLPYVDESVLHIDRAAVHRSELPLGEDVR
mmetsp:Transcript_90855/g.259927  ORF Transcript_90855/g.259927 Transcript_90855/m.259927 type:complete len:253 (+) Transcript_90855:579-1337(+)